MPTPRSPFLHLGLTGYPLGHSLSPVLHQAALESLDLRGEYRLYPVGPDEADHGGLRALVERMRRGELDGLNVTIPHKQSMPGLVDELTPAAKAVGAVNTLYCREGRVSGHNTDVEGFLTGVKSVLPGGEGFAGARALVLGAGGSARAVVYGLVQTGWQVMIAARRPEQSRSLATELGGEAIPLETIGRLGPVALVVNTTPLGMVPAIHGSPWPEKLAFPKDTAVYDLVYNPPETALVRAARAAGLRAETGLEMLVVQAVLAFACWTGLTPSKSAMWQAALKQLEFK